MGYVVHCFLGSWTVSGVWTKCYQDAMIQSKLHIAFSRRPEVFKITCTLISSVCSLVPLPLP